MAAHEGRQRRGAVDFDASVLVTGADLPSRRWTWGSTVGSPNGVLASSPPPDSDSIAVGRLFPFSDRYREGLNQIVVDGTDPIGPIASILYAGHSAGNREYDGPVWSPDGFRMAFVSEGTLYTAAVDNKGAAAGPPRLVVSDGEFPSAPSWERDSEHIVFQTPEGLKRVGLKKYPETFFWFETVWNPYTNPEYARYAKDYPFQLIWWESGGDSECEWFIVDATTGEQILINDLAHTNAFVAAPLNAYRPATIAPARPYVRSIRPAPGATSVATNTTIDVAIVDGAARVVTNSIQLTLNGTLLTPSISQASGVTTVSSTSRSRSAAQVAVISASS